MNYILVSSEYSECRGFNHKYECTAHFSCFSIACLLCKSCPGQLLFSWSCLNVITPCMRLRTSFLFWTSLFFFWQGLWVFPMPSSLWRSLAKSHCCQLIGAIVTSVEPLVQLESCNSANCYCSATFWSSDFTLHCSGPGLLTAFHLTHHGSTPLQRNQFLIWCGDNISPL